MNEAIVLAFGRRKAIKIRYTRYVALPPDWARENLGKTGEIALSLLSDGSLRIESVRDGDVDA